MNLGSIKTSLGYISCQSLLSQGDKNCKFKVVDLSIKNVLISLITFYC